MGPSRVKRWNSVQKMERYNSEHWSTPSSLPFSLRAEVFQMFHSTPSAGHLGAHRTLHRLHQRFYWPNNKVDIINWYQKCSLCQIHNPVTKQTKAHMKQYIVGAPMERVAMDIFGLVTQNKDWENIFISYQWLFYLLDWVSPWPTLRLPLWLLLSWFQFVCWYGVPKQVHTDQGSQFESNLFQEVCKILDIDKTRTTPNHAQSEGLVERFNHTSKCMLNKYVGKHPRDWDLFLPLLMLAIDHQYMIVQEKPKVC